MKHKGEKIPPGYITLALISLSLCLSMGMFEIPRQPPEHAGFSDSQLSTDQKPLSCSAEQKPDHILAITECSSTVTTASTRIQPICASWQVKGQTRTDIARRPQRPLSSFVRRTLEPVPERAELLSSPALGSASPSCRDESDPATPPLCSSCTRLPWCRAFVKWV